MRKFLTTTTLYGLVGCLFSSEVPTCEAEKVAMHVVGIVVLYALVPKVVKGHCRGMDTGNFTKQALGRVTPHAAKLHHLIKSLCCDFGSWLADEIVEALCRLKTYREGKDRKNIESELKNKTYCKVIKSESCKCL